MTEVFKRQVISTVALNNGSLAVSKFWFDEIALLAINLKS